MDDDKQRRPFSTATTLTTKQQLAGTMYGQHARIPEHLREIMEQVCGDPVDNQKAIDVGLRPPEAADKPETLAESRARMQTAQDNYKPVLVGGRTGVVGVFDFNTWTWDTQWDLWEEDHLQSEAHAKLAGVSSVEAHAKLAGDPKELLLFYLEHVLPLTTAKGVVFPVLLFLWKRAPQNLRSFKISHQEIAAGSGAGVRSVQRAIAFLEQHDLIKVVQEPWSPRRSSRAEYTLLPLAKLRHTPTWRTSF